MKEHSFFLQLGFTPRDGNFTARANEFRLEFDNLLSDVVSISDGVVSNSVLNSGEVVTSYTLEAERVSTLYTGVKIPTDITKAELNLTGRNRRNIHPSLESHVYDINNRAIGLISQLIRFKATILENVLNCNMFTLNYPLLIDHIMREAELYLSMVERLQRKGFVDIERDALEQEAFWNRIMAEHAKFIRGLLDPTEEALINTANNFGNEFDQLTRDAINAMDRNNGFCEVTENSLRATEAIRDFKEQGTIGLLDCNIRSIIIPLLGDHTLREANHFLRLLNKFRC